MKVCAVLAGILAGAALAGCSTLSNTVGDPFIAPGKFQFLRCPDIAKRFVEAQSRERQLYALMERAGSGIGGSVVNWTVYQPDLQGVQAELRALRQAAEEKRCADELLKAAPKADVGPIH
jgi:hypothetical protein